MNVRCENTVCTLVNEGAAWNIFNLEINIKRTLSHHIIFFFDFMKPAEHIETIALFDQLEH